MKKSLFTKKMKQRLKRILVGVSLLVIVIALDLLGLFTMLEDKIGFGNAQNIKLAAFLIVYFASGHFVLKKALNNLKKGQWMDEIFLMTIASIGAFVLGEYHEAIAVILFFETGELFQDYAVKKSRNAITELMDVRPVYANLKTGDTFKKIDPSEVKQGDILIIMPGEKIPVDGKVVKGQSNIDKKAMTGESVPEEVSEGYALVSGCINLTSVIEMEATSLYADSTVAKVLELMQSQSAKKAKTEEFISKFAKYYTPSVVALAILIAIIPSITFDKGNFSTWVYSALTFLVISCPCALVISVPLSFFGGIGGASVNGILIKGAEYIEIISKLNTVAFDKTGTLTKGSFQVAEIEGSVEPNEILRLVASCEQFSTHPIAASIVSAAKELKLPKTDNIKELSGLGISATYNDKKVLVGNERLMKENQVEVIDSHFNKACTKVYLAEDGVCIGVISVVDVIKPEAKTTIARLKKQGVENVVMLTGDKVQTANEVAAELGIDRVYAELLPEDKVNISDKLRADNSKGTIAFAGDGINDAPVLAGVDLGISFGGVGSDAAVEASDMVIMNDDLSKISLSIKIARKTMAIVKQNIVFAIAVKLIVLLLSALGCMYMWLAVIADVGVCLIAVLNAIRTIGIKG